MPIEVVSGEAAVANVANEKFNLLLYGEPGTGKTTDAVQAFTQNGRCNAFFIQCEPGALKPIVARGLPVPDHTKHVVQTWPDLVEACTYAAQAKRYSGVIIDTLTTWTSNVYLDLEKNMKTKNRWDIPNAMHGMLRDLRDGCRNLGLNVVMIAHAIPAIYTETGALKQKGGPHLSPKSAMDRFTGAVDSILRVDVIRVGVQYHRVYFTGGLEWPAGLGMPPSDAGLWWAKNREGVGQMAVPADLAAYLRMRNPPYPGF